MRWLKVMEKALLTILIAAPAFAVDTTQAYFSGYIALGFVALCALIVVAQVAPAVMLFVGFVKAIGEMIREKLPAHAEGKK
ncbi:MAG: hypothetical protein C0609_11890 [Deltaproteobacteria bacterium]|nr:MAG: hypothetical protein C0609_11890 [Deltaproteobacteria bacterium]